MYNITMFSFRFPQVWYISHLHSFSEQKNGEENVQRAVCVHLQVMKLLKWVSCKNVNTSEVSVICSEHTWILRTLGAMMNSSSTCCVHRKDMLQVKEQYQHPEFNETAEGVFSREPFIIWIRSPTTCTSH